MGMSLHCSQQQGDEEFAERVYVFPRSVKKSKLSLTLTSFIFHIAAPVYVSHAANTANKIEERRENFNRCLLGGALQLKGRARALLIKRQRQGAVIEDVHPAGCESWSAFRTRMSLCHLNFASAAGTRTCRYFCLINREHFQLLDS